MDKEKLLSCKDDVKPYVHNTPVLTSQLINEIAGCKLFFKCENFQKMGAFKMRGALYALQKLKESEKQKGVITHSSGNFAQALSLAARTLGIKAYIVMPENAPNVKKEAVKAYGGNITECEATLEAREKMTQLIAQETGATFIHPSNDENVILGNSTACQELLASYPDLDAVFAPVGGGGLLAGTALAAHHISENCKVYAGEPFAVDDAYHSLECGQIVSNNSTATIADGLRTELGDINFPIIQKFVTAIIRVTEEEIIETMRLIWERMKIVCEPSSAVALAALLKQKEQFAGQKVGIILSGGNVDLTRLPF